MKKIYLLIIVAFLWAPQINAFVVDHHAVQKFHQIPDYWLGEARKLSVLYGHTSHGSQIISGMAALAAANGAKYNVHVEDEGNAQNSSTLTPVAASQRVPVSLPSGIDRLWITREGAWPYGWWSTAEGLQGTKNILSQAGGLFNVAGWAWCGQVGACPDYLNCNNDQYIWDYIDAMESLEAASPSVRVFYMTGHLDNGSPHVKRRNDIIRNYCAANNKILFDFADIEAHDLSGNYHPDAGVECSWCQSWCDDHPSDFECRQGVQNWTVSGGGCGRIDSCAGKCAHTNGLNCLIKAEAFWYMLARIAGWNGGSGAKKLLGDFTGTLGAYFGHSASINGDTVVVGAYYAYGSAYIFDRDQGGTDNWGRVKKIIASGGSGYDRFGFSVSISGDTVVVGADLDDDNGSNSGAAYIFNRNQGGTNNWGQVQKITASDGVANDQFGYSVSISGDTVVVGAFRDNETYTGKAYIFDRDQGGTNNWGQVKKITEGDGEAGDYFGISVSISGDTVVVGAYRDDDLSGSAYIFDRDEGGSNNWGQVKKIKISDEHYFGFSVSIGGDTVVVGSGHSAYIFDRDEGGINNWGLVQEITASGSGIPDNFGESVSISGNTVVVGASQDDGNGENSGSAYIFKRNQGGSDKWGQVQKITASDGATGDQFGFSVSIIGDTLVVGAKGDDDNGNLSGSAYVFSVTEPAMDFNGDAKRDILWRHSTTGEDVIWLMDGTSLDSYAWLDTVSDINWKIIKVADFDTDGDPDILWRHNTSGQNFIWVMDGTSLDSYAWLDTVADNNWEIAALADFNKDGDPDILWRNSSTGQNVIWVMDGTSLNSYAWLDKVSDTNWEIIELSDFDTDGDPDILWRNSSSGQNVIWKMDGTSLDSYAWLDTVLDTNWKIVEIADFDKDGDPDILWRHATSGQNVIWVMEGTSIDSYAWLPTVVDMSWEIADVADFDKDGDPDILWRHSTSGQNVIWVMDGTSLNSYAWLDTVLDTNWEIQ